MKKLVSCITTAVLSLAFVVSVSPAEGFPTVDFDQSIDAASFLKAAQNISDDEQSQAQGPKGKLVDIHPQVKIDELPSDLKAIVPSAAPWFFGPWQSKIYNHPSYRRGLTYPPRVQKLPDDVREPLEQQWRDLIDEGNGLLDQAKVLEPDDRNLYSEGVWLRDEKAYLDAESARIAQDRAAYRARCWVDAPPSDCEAERGRLNARIDRRNARVRPFNDRLAKWKADRTRIQAEGESLDQEIETWGGRIDAYSDRAEEALENAGWTTVRFQAQGDDMPGGGKSKVIDYPGPMCVEAGEQGLGELRESLTASEYRQRDQAIVRAYTWMRNVAASGGLQGPQPNKPFYNDNPSPANARIDIEIIRGLAFVHCPAVLQLASPNE